MDKSNRKFFNDKQDTINWLAQLFERYANGQATEKEKEIIENWNPDSGKTAYNATETEVKEGCNAIWQRLTVEFGFEQETPKPIVKQKVIRLSPFIKYAVAAMAILFAGIGTYFFTSKETIQNKGSQQYADNKTYFESKKGEHLEITLPDGSTVHLNSNTKVAIIKTEFNTENREFWLEEGEAFFKIAKNPEKPFIIHSSSLQTTVLGTSFNIKAYKELDETSVSVRDGKVQVEHQGNLLGVFTKNKQITFNKTTGSTVKSEVSWEDAASWMENRLVMSGANAKEFKLRLKQHFNVTVEIKNNKLDGKLLSCSFPRDVSLKEVMDGISLLYNIKYDLSQSDKLIIY
ncbi:FecR family protein [Flavobacterium gyeonganense]|uniref:FecR family protein n=1 Tax=Flavobacterium gyeonganense TaxID=1310418 RepID=A0ABV5HF73_9FLAO|nr:FecR family protein [Flavobacterium gyeonganense]